jgi:hypothetical protein
MLSRPRSSYGGSIQLILPDEDFACTEAAAVLVKSIERFDSALSVAEMLAPPPNNRAAVSHLRQAAVVLGVGAFDAYVRHFVIDAYLQLIFAGKPPAEPPMHGRKLSRQLCLLILVFDRVARLLSEEARLHLATSVFSVNQVRTPPDHSRLRLNFSGMLTSTSQSIPTRQLIVRNCNYSSLPNPCSTHTQVFATESSTLVST